MNKKIKSQFPVGLVVLSDVKIKAGELKFADWSQFPVGLVVLSDLLRHVYNAREMDVVSIPCRVGGPFGQAVSAGIAVKNGLSLNSLSGWWSFRTTVRGDKPLRRQHSVSIPCRVGGPFGRIQRPPL